MQIAKLQISWFLMQFTNHWTAVSPRDHLAVSKMFKTLFYWLFCKSH